MSNIHRRIKEARLSKGLTQAQLAEMLNLSTTAIQLWENNDQAKATAPKRKRLDEVSKILGVSVSWLQFGQSLVAPAATTGLVNDINSSYTHKKIMIYNLDLSAGSGNAQWVLSEPDEPLLIRNSWFKSKNFLSSDLRAMRVRGNSMSPHLENNDIVIINIKDIDPIDGEIYAVIYNDRFFIKRLKQTGEGIHLISSNSDYEPIEVFNADTDKFQILGRKVWRGG